MKKILYITPHASTGGAPQVLVKRLETLKNDYDIYVVEYSNISDHFVVQKNRIKSLIKKENYYTLGEDKNNLLNIIKNIKPDIIHFEEMPEVFNMDIGLTSKIFNNQREYKIFCTTHSSDFNVDDTIFYPDKFIFVSQFNSFKFAKLGVPIDVVEYPTDPVVIDENERKKYREELGLSDDYFHILNVGLFTPRKNQAYSMEIARRLINEKVIVHFVGNMADNFRHYWEPLMKNVPSNCKIWNERSDVDKFYTACDLFLFTSRGFKYNKELNPLVIKEAMVHELPQLLFPLDVYCGKYDNNPWITYLDGNIDNDVKIVMDTINDIKSGKYKELKWIVEDKSFDIKDVPELPPYDIDIQDEYINNDIIDIKNIQEESNNVFTETTITRENNKLFNDKYKVRAVHLLLNGDERNMESIKSISPISNYGITYIKHFNNRYVDIPPRDSCYRPGDVGRIGPYALNGPHYGVYTSFKNAVIQEFTTDTDFLLIFEGDCLLKTDIETFIKNLKTVLDIMFFHDISYTSLGSRHNLMTNELVSVEKEKIPYCDLMCITDRIIGIQSIIFSNYCRDFLFNTYKTEKWDVSDLYYNRIFTENYKKAILYEPLTYQSEKKSSIDDIDKTHFYNRKNLKVSYDDILTQYNTYDNKIYLSLRDVYINDVSFSIIIKDRNGVILHKGDIKFTPHETVWFQIENIKNYNRIYIDFIDIITKKNLFTKDIIIDLNKSILYENNSELTDFEIINEDEKYIDITEKDFDFYYNIKDRKVYIKYLRDKKTKFFVILYNIINDIELMKTSLECHNSYFVWLQHNVNHTNTNGYTIDIYDEDHNFLFKKDVLFNTDIKDVKENVHVFHTKNGLQDMNKYVYPNTAMETLQQHGDAATMYWSTFIQKELENGGLTIDKDDVFVDLGANIGMSSRYARLKNVKEIYCFEPDKKLVELLKKNVPSAIVYDYAIDSDYKEVELYHWPYNNVDVGPKYKCKTIKLKDVINIIGKPIDYMKIDIEGFEENIFDELTYEECSNINKLFVEYHEQSRIENFCNTLKNKGFNILHINPGMGQSFIYAKHDMYKKFSNINNDINDDIIIISTYPNTRIKEDVTISCIKQLKKLNKKILLSSHYPVSKEIQEMVDFYLYDSYNPVIRHSYYNRMWKKTDDYDININFENIVNVGGNQSLTVYNNIYNSISFSKDMGFKRVFSFTYDSVIDDKDLYEIENISRRINEENKKGYFITFKDNDMLVMKSVFFVIGIDYYLNVFDNVRTEENYNIMCKKINSENFLEHVFYQKLKNNINDLIVDDTTEDIIFNNSDINIFSECEYPVVVQVKDNPGLYTIWYNSNNTKDDRDIEISLYGDNYLIYNEKFKVKEKENYFRIFRKYNNIEYKVVYSFYDNNVKYKDDLIYMITDDDIKRNGEFIIHKPLPIIDKKNIITIIDYNTNYYETIKEKISICKVFSRHVIIPICDHLNKDQKEDRHKLEMTYLQNDCENVNFIEYEYDNVLDDHDEKMIFNIGRKIAFKNSDKESKYIIIVEPNDIINKDIIPELYQFNDKDIKKINKDNDFLIIKKDDFNHLGIADKNFIKEKINEI